MDIPESVLILALKTLVVYHKAKETNASTMEVDSNAVPSLMSFLALCVQYSISTTAWRIPIKEHFSNMDDLLYILLILESWFSQWAVHDVSILSRHHGPTQEAKRRKSRIRRRYENLPHVDNVWYLILYLSNHWWDRLQLISFLQAILDAVLSWCQAFYQ